MIQNTVQLKTMPKNRSLRWSGLKYSCLLCLLILLTACSNDQAPDQISTEQPESGRTLPPPGMRVYKDPVTGEFVAQPPAEDRTTVQLQPQSLQQISPDNTTESQPEQAREYESPAEGGGILLDLPPPYSDTQE